MPIFLKVNHQLESRIQEIWQSGSEGGAKPTLSLPLFQPRVSTLGNIQKKRFALKGREITWAKCVRLLPKGRGYLLGRDTISRWLK